MILACRFLSGRGSTAARRLAGGALGFLLLLPAMRVDVRAQLMVATNDANDHAPHFLFAGHAGPIALDVSRTPALAQRIALDLEGTTVKGALAVITQASGLHLVYSDDIVALGGPVHLRAAEITVAAALTDVLLDAGVDVVFTPDGRAALVRRRGAGVQHAGAVVGRVTDAKTGRPIPYASVLLEGTGQGTTTSDSGTYRIANVAPGTYAAIARILGYLVARNSVTVSGDRPTILDFALEKSPNQLDQVVVAGTAVPTEVRALPTPVTVITENDIALAQPHTVQELFRQAVPTGVSWDLAAIPAQTIFSVRGASTLSGGAGQMKVFLDGIPVADFSAASIDPASIGRIEVIRGPQAAAIYGSDAIGGVIQIFTKRGDSTLTRPQVDAQAALGLVQTPYPGYKGEARQMYTASVRGGATDISYNFGAGYTHIPDWVQPVSAQSSPSVYGGVNITRGILTADVTGRYYAQDVPGVFNPALAPTGVSFFAAPYYLPEKYTSQTVGARLTLSPTGWWQHTLTLGVDGSNNDGAQTRPRLTTPSDTLLLVQTSVTTKTSIGYNTSIRGNVSADVYGSLTAGFDYYDLPIRSWSTGGAVATTGTIVTDPNQPVSAYRYSTHDAGYFTQGQLAFRDMLFLTGGLRVERNSEFGDSLHTPVSPQVGLSFVHPVGEATLKVRGSWGQAIRPPSPESKVLQIMPGNIQLASPRLAPERQQGWDMGVDAIFGSRGSLDLTYFNQVASDLIQLVQVSATPALTTDQNQNVGRVKNSGVEIEGAVAVGPLQLKGQYGYVASKIQDLGPNYTGDQQVGDQTLFTPARTAGVSLSVAPWRGTILAAGLSYAGSYIAYDLFALYRCFGGTGACRSGPGLRSYYENYPSFVKINATLSQQLTRQISAFVSLDNLTNNTILEFSQASPIMGRITTVGVRIHR